MLSGAKHLVSERDRDVFSCQAQSMGRMFDRIAPTYDLLNHLLSLGRDRSWRRRTADRIPRTQPLRVADLATGTADMLLAVLQARPNVTEAEGLDVAGQMLEIGRRKVQRAGFADRVRFMQGDLTQTPFEAGSLDLVTMAFGIRNTPDPATTLREVHRILKPGGLALILEFSLPACPVMRWAHLIYLRLVVPLVGAVLSGDRQAYRYLNKSIEAFHKPDAFCGLMEREGFTQTAAIPLTGGIASIYEGVRK
jgi:demethylmenaquinone methyltransferase / 2-methoxy-6-polyprenyl-1,4-benzoquinol methylase